MESTWKRECEHCVVNETTRLEDEPGRRESGRQWLEHALVQCVENEDEGFEVVPYPQTTKVNMREVVESSGAVVPVYRKPGVSMGSVPESQGGGWREPTDDVEQCVGMSEQRIAVSDDVGTPGSTVDPPHAACVFEDTGTRTQIDWDGDEGAGGMDMRGGSELNADASRQGRAADLDGIIDPIDLQADESFTMMSHDHVLGMVA